MSTPLNLAEETTRRSVDRRWIALSFIALAQLMIALDATIVSIALPWAQRALGASDAQRQWVITAYTLAFAGLLLVGGRIADTFGRKRTFVIGLAGFALASAVGGSAATFGVLLAARAAQGAFAALLAPAALLLLAVTFTQPHERARAFALYGAIAGSGAALGLLLGGVLTQYFGWRWCLYVNIPIAVAAAVGGWRALGGNGGGHGQRVDIPGVVFATGGLVAFVVREARTSAPLLPLQIVLDRNRGGAYLAVAFAIAGMFGAFLFLTYYLQVVMRYSPLQAGLAFLPLTLASQAGSWGIASVLMPRVPARWIMAPGALTAAAGMLILTQIQVDSGFVTHVLLAEILLGIGIACVMAPAFNVGTRGVDPRQAGVAAATVNAATQIGASLGTAILNTIAASATAAYLAGFRPSPTIVNQAFVHGYAVATAWAAGVLVLGAVSTAVLIDAGRPAPQVAHRQARTDN